MQDDFIAADLVKTTTISGLVHLNSFPLGLHFYFCLFTADSVRESQDKLK